MAELERRNFELRHEIENRVVSGTALKFGDIANIAGYFRERFSTGSLSIGEDPVMNVQHDRGRLLARKGAGLDVVSTVSSVQVRAQLPKTRIAEDALEMIGAGLLRGLSIEFQVREDEWTDDDVPLRTITDAELMGVAVVDKPAYPQSTLDDREARSILEAAYRKYDYPEQNRRWYI